jgi:hypothetical protein
VVPCLRRRTQRLDLESHKPRISSEVWGFFFIGFHAFQGAVGRKLDRHWCPTAPWTAAARTLGKRSWCSPPTPHSHTVAHACGRATQSHSRYVRGRMLLDRVPLTRTLRSHDTQHPIPFTPVAHACGRATLGVAHARLRAAPSNIGVLPRMHGNAAPLRVVLRTLRAALLFVHSLTATYTVLVAPLRVVLRTLRATRRLRTGASACGPTPAHTPAGASPRSHTVATAVPPQRTHVPRYQPEVLGDSKLPYIHMYPYLYLLIQIHPELISFWALFKCYLHIHTPPTLISFWALFKCYLIYHVHCTLTRMHIPSSLCTGVCMYVRMQGCTHVCMQVYAPVRVCVQG